MVSELKHEFSNVKTLRACQGVKQRLKRGFRNVNHDVLSADSSNLKVGVLNSRDFSIISWIEGSVEEETKQVAIGNSGGSDQRNICADSSHFNVGQSCKVRIDHRWNLGEYLFLSFSEDLLENFFSEHVDDVSHEVLLDASSHLNLGVLSISGQIKFQKLNCESLFSAFSNTIAWDVSVLLHKSNLQVETSIAHSSFKVSFGDTQGLELGGKIKVNNNVLVFLNFEANRVCLRVEFGIPVLLE